MRLPYKLSAVCGPVYTQGNIIFDKRDEGYSVISPVYNRLNIFDIKQNQMRTLPFDMKRDITSIALSPNGLFLVMIDESCRGILVNYPQQVVLCHFKCKHPKPKRISFSPDSRFFAIGCFKTVQVWKTPDINDGKHFAPLSLFIEIKAHNDQITSLTWSPKLVSHPTISNKPFYYLLTSSKDMNTKLLIIQDNTENDIHHTPTSLIGHNGPLLGSFFMVSEPTELVTPELLTIYTLSKGMLLTWKNQTKWTVINRHHIGPSKATSYAVSHKQQIVVIGQESGTFTILSLPDYHVLQTFNLFPRAKISTIAIHENGTGEWIAFARPGHIVIWEWTSETFILKQHGHAELIQHLSFPFDEGRVGQRLLATGSHDGTVQVWDRDAALSIIKFNDHSGPITGVMLTKHGQVLVSSSMDGTIRAYDMKRYQCFKTLTTPLPTGLTCFTADTSGELIFGSSGNAQDVHNGGGSFDIYVWSLQTGQLIDILSGHQGPIQSLSSDPTRSGWISSGSLDKTVRIWSLYRQQKSSPLLESVLDIGSEVSCVQFRPDGKELAVSSLNGQILFFDGISFDQIASIDGSKDAAGGRYSTDLFTAANSPRKYFTCLCYSPDSTLLLAGGVSNHICMYDMTCGILRPLLRQVVISHNLGLEGVQEKLNSKYLKNPIDTDDSDNDQNVYESKRNAKALPGTVKKRSIRCLEIKFSPDGQQWSAATTDGLLIYSLDDTMLFDPMDGLLPDMTSENILFHIENGKYIIALHMALRLNDEHLIQKVVASVPKDKIASTILINDHGNNGRFMGKYLDRLLCVISDMLDKLPMTDILLEWVRQLLLVYGPLISSRYNRDTMTGLRSLYQSILRIYQPLSQMANENKQLLQWVMIGMNRVYLS